MVQPISRAATAFEGSIEDATILLQYFDDMRQQSAERAEVLKRAGLVMALTAWETYVEDRVVEAVQVRLRAIEGSPTANFVLGKLQDELKRFNNPASDKTKRLFLDYLNVDVTAGWKWLNFDPPLARKTLDEFIARRGNAVHRSRPVNGGPPTPHLVKRDDLDRAIRFLKGLVAATDRGLLDT